MRRCEGVRRCKGRAFLCSRKDVVDPVYIVQIRTFPLLFSEGLCYVF